jgi:hypothetical protein
MCAGNFDLARTEQAASICKDFSVSRISTDLCDLTAVLFYAHLLIAFVTTVTLPGQIFASI